MSQSPTHIGPYRIDAVVGRGGMGQVYKAWDQRLRRWVALKVLHVSPEAEQQAILHEARMIASLNHPHIMQIYDIVEHQDQQVLVLEWVEGVTLHRLQNGRALPVLQSYHYSRQVLTALATTHRLGLIHGDLKAENIMVNSEGQIKVLDFGLAYHRQHHHQGSAGTSRCMSPEQIQQKTVDGRADLFSLGVLMYEMLSGSSPFRRQDNASTIQAVLNEAALRLDQIDPQIPTPLAQLVEQFLSKTPEQRPASADLALLELDTLRGVITSAEFTPAAQAQNPTQANPTLREGQSTLAATPTSGAANGHFDERTLIQQPTMTQPPVGAGQESSHGSAWSHSQLSGNMPPQATGQQHSQWSTTNPTPPSQRWRWIALTLGLTLLGTAGLTSYWNQQQGTTALRYVAVATPSVSGLANSEQVATIQASIRQAARQELENHRGLVVLPDGTPISAATQLDESIHTSLVCAGNECNAHIERQDGSQQQLWRRSFSSPPDPPLLYRALRVYLQEAYADLPVLRQQSHPINPADLDRLLWLQAEFERNELQHLDSNEMLDQVEQLLTQSPDFQEAHLLRSRILLYRYHQQADPQDLDLAQEALGKTDSSSGQAIVLFEIALAQRDTNAAAEALEQFATLQPGSATILAMRSRLAEQQNELQRALILMHEAASRQPSWRHWFWAAEMAYRQGDIELARKDLENLLHLVPEHYGGLSLLAEIEMQSGALSTAESLYRRLVLRSPQLTELSNLGTVYLFLGNYEQAAQSFHRALELAPENPYVQLNLADAIKLQGDTETAKQRYRQLADTLNQQAQDSALNDNLLGVLVQAQAHTGQAEAAVSQLQTMLEQADHQPQALYTAALVYAVLQQTEPAREYRQQAQNAGIDNLWFGLPWFAGTEP
ncbi:MAG: protein kinase [Xanthomonadales bacterium]|nr:protein kinase [Xanthomonadales bacterium]